ncbi:uncharacterized protein LOC119190675 [Manduca sexta]|uniref:Gustatory receptor 35 n=1 Tax=Manduca sexta TaxID=7130 RepID=A0A5K8B644_MANSE|nr:uncharacterized protein LOC119190675 [Manduca sexta]CUQ99375.1 TPA: Gustatory receptor 35 [Manduca sexta]
MSNIKKSELEKTVDILLNNAIGKDIQSIMRPLNLIQNIYCAPKYRIKDNFIIPNGIYENLISFSAVLALLIICVSNIAFSSCPIKILSADLICISDVLNEVISLMGFIINSWVSITQSNNNVQLLLLLQTNHRLMEFAERDVSLLKISNWIKVIALYSCSLGVYTSLHMYFHIPYIHTVFFDVIVLCFDMNMVYAIFIMKLIVKNLIHWHKEIQKPENALILYKDRMFHLYMNIMLAYKLFKKAFQLLVSSSIHDFY